MIDTLRVKIKVKKIDRISWQCHFEKKNNNKKHSSMKCCVFKSCGITNFITCLKTSKWSKSTCLNKYYLPEN